MASPFERFIQLELPKRPYLEKDVSTESIIIRRGSGTRQLDGLILKEGQHPVFRDGVIRGEDVVKSNLSSIIHTQLEAEDKWVISHTNKNKSVVITILDSLHFSIIPDNVKVETDSITIDFIVPQAGYANIIFL